MSEQESKQGDAIDNSAALETLSFDPSTRPTVVDRSVWHAELRQLRIREQAHTHEGDAIAAARRRLSMAQVDGATPLLGLQGPITLPEVFEGRKLLIVYFHMWQVGQPASGQCEGCTFSNSQARELAYLQAGDGAYLTFCEGPYAESVRYRDFMGWNVPWYSVPQDSVDRLLAKWHFGVLVSYLRDDDQVFETYWTTGRGNEVMAASYGLLDMTVYGRQET
jgi:predicted dithiol-disulfide oxidoreductase (DUF899 family)